MIPDDWNPYSDDDDETKPWNIYRFMFFFGLAIYVMFFLVPSISLLRSWNWRKTPCVITSSKIVRQNGVNGPDTSRVRIGYKYRFENIPYLYDQYNFSIVSGEINALQKIVKQYPPKAKSFCYVNPNNPIQAVLKREITTDLLAFLCFAISILCIFVGLLVGFPSILARLKSTVNRTAGLASSGTKHQI